MQEKAFENIAAEIATFRPAIRKTILHKKRIMNYIDIIIGILLILAAINGFRKGFVVEIVSLLALILGIWGAIHFSHIASGFLSDYFTLNPRHMRVIAFIITFIVIVILVHLLGKVAENFIKAAQLNFVNRLAGLLFGIVKSAVILSIILMVIDTIDKAFPIIPEKAKEESRVYAPISNLMPSIFPFVKNWTNTNILGKENDQTSEEDPGTDKK